VCFSLSIPDSTVSSNNGDIYLQISGPTTYSWIGVAQGSQMPGANYFIIYTSANGQNVTLSPRLASSRNTPSFNSAAQVTLLEGSGVSGGVMTANIKCKMPSLLDGHFYNAHDNQARIATPGTEEACSSRPRAQIGSGVSSLEVV
jgi:hypothetical protein